MQRLLGIAVALFLISPCFLLAQDFTDIGISLTASSIGSCEWGDYDNDGDLDFFYLSNTTTTQLARNGGYDNFTPVTADFISVYTGDGEWGDYDNDGDLDLALTGDNSGVPMTRIYRNDGWGNFTDINAGLVNVSQSSLAWGDYNNDGRLDLVVSGINDEEEPVAVLYKNDTVTLMRYT